MLIDNSSVQNSHFENAQQYSMKSMTLGNAIEATSSDHNNTILNLRGVENSEMLSQVPLGMYYANGSVTVGRPGPGSNS